MTGIICLNKPQNISSFLAVKKASRLLGVKKAGHTGTLDPLATGVLVIMLGGGTRFIDFLPESEKSYTARVLLGTRTDTLDITGNVLEEKDVHVTENEIIKVCEGFLGETMQIPPMFSAIQKDGVRLYDLARKGIEIERTPRKINIKEITAYNFDGKSFSLDVTCSAGTYIRSLASDIGEFLGTGACLTSLCRTKANGFSVDCALTLEEIEEHKIKGDIEKYIIPVEKALSFYGAVTVSSAQSVRFRNGGELDIRRIHNNFENKLYRVFSPDNQFLGLGEADTERGILKPKRVFVSSE
ncbi:MAG: tRNA pseudouridine(55) synthase TruB [Oscillospiraceae bacterium]|nr:tRNA pseudouridine(55) synthase TruB [Oscillospiraceae bacterium]